MDQPDAAVFEGYCRGCGYFLRGLESRRCPECGRGFDPSNRRTFRRRPPRAWRWWAMRITVLLLLLALIPTAGVGWLYREWRQEQAAIEVWEENAEVSRATKLIGPPWLQNRVPERFSWLLERVEHLVIVVSPDDAIFDDSDFARLTNLKHLDRLYFLSPVPVDVTDDGIAHLASLRKLNVLDLRNTRISDAGLAHLRYLEDLEILNLYDTEIRGPGLRHLENLNNLRSLTLRGGLQEPQYLEELAKLESLRELGLSGEGMDDVALEHLVHIPTLESLHLRGTNVSDEGLQALAEMRGLRHLNLIDNPQVSEEAVEVLRRSLPETMVYGP